MGPGEKRNGAWQTVPMIQSKKKRMPYSGLAVGEPWENERQKSKEAIQRKTPAIS